MKKILSNKWFILSLEIAFFILIFALSIIPLRDFDIWFHIKSGEIIAKLGIIHYDVFSYNTGGREWFPYEWLFQIIVYFTQQITGFESIKYFIAALAAAQVFLIYTMLKTFFLKERLTSLGISFLFFASVFEFITARPQMFAYTFLFINLWLIYLYFFKNKNLLYFSIPITLMWANLHGSIFLDVGLFFGYSFIAILNYFVEKKDRNWLNRGKTLAFWGVITSFLTILPPLYLTQYRLLYIFFQDRNIISKFIDEWTPLYINPIPFAIYTTTVIVICSFFIFVNIKNKSLKKCLWVIPLTPFIFVSYTASRNLFLAYIPLAFMLGSTINFIYTTELKRAAKITVVCLLLILICANIWLLWQKMQTQTLYYPVKPVNFLKLHHINGHMFNEYGYGGYLLYQLYPEYKVFYDGRTDLYLPREIPDVLNISINKHLSDNEFSKYLYLHIWDKYNISFVMLRTEKNTLPRKIMHELAIDPNWVLVFWDDYNQIYVRRDGKNDGIISEFGTTAATPYEREPYRKGTLDKALLEYEKMLQIADSAKTRNTIGYIFLQKGKYSEAKQMFEIATTLDPSDESPLMNLAELAAKNKNYSDAISLYLQAKNLAPDRGLIYIRLGQLYLLENGDINSAKEIWQEGVNNTIDTSAKNQLNHLLQQ